MRRYLSSLLLGAALCAPVVMYAQDEHHDKRYYDRERKDYHEWNEREERAYRHWLQEERRREYHPWEKARREEQREYWRWRHEHMDWH
jgi:type III secretory pathway component EscR